jgi:hypothetical protein
VTAIYFFAWLQPGDDPRPIILEIGMAAALEKPVVISHRPDSDGQQLFFQLYCDYSFESHHSLEAWDSFWSQVSVADLGLPTVAEVLKGFES